MHLCKVLLPLFLAIVCGSVHVRGAQASSQPAKVAVLDFGESPLGRRVADTMAKQLASTKQIAVVDRDASRAAAQGGGYSGSLNMSLREAKDLGAAIECDFYITGDAQALRRSTSSNPVYFEAYASIFLVDSGTGRLVMWERPSFEGPAGKVAENRLLDSLVHDDLGRYINAIKTTQDRDQQQRVLPIDTTAAPIAEAPEDEKAAAAEGLRLPKPYRRLKPVYPETATRADAEAVVDVMVDVDAAGEVSSVNLFRWAGFGLDESTIETVRQLHFFPAMRNGIAIPMRVLLRYNFRKSTK